ncbi:MAG: acetyl-CoA carboxylase biotin carboxyl carrier protein [Pseudomonadota bacterium]
MDLRKIKKLIELVEESQIASLKISENGETIEISKPTSSVTHYTTAPTHAPAPVAAPVLEQASHKPAATDDSKHHRLTSPMVGTIYLSATPGADPFVEVGQTVKKGQTICLIEAMKMFNQIEADKSGVITARLVENASPVEFGQPLFIIE